ncbi:MAG: hypothetical protein Q8900_09535, partial [Bacillota bacterium]|nr:hypothetical protein [Bacillota bacterium]
MGIMNFSEIMDRAIDVLKKYFGSIILFNLIYGIITTIVMFVLIFIGVIVGLIFGFATAGALSSFKFGSLPIISMIIVGIIVFVFIVIGITISRGLNVGVIRISSQEFVQGKIGFSEALGSTFKNIHKVLGLSFIEGILFLPALAVFLIPVYFFYYMAKSADPNFKSTAAQSALSVMLVLFCCTIVILLFIAVIYLYNTLFIFSVNSIIMENESVIGSLKRSWQLIKRDFWKLYGCNILIVLSISAIRYSLSSVIAVLVSILLLILKLLNANQNLLTYFNMIYSQLSWPITIISYLIINPIGIIMTNLMYFNQRFKREGYDMTIELNKIQSNAKVIINERKQASGNIEFSNSNNSNKTT